MSKFELNVKYTNDNGSWVILRTAPNRFNYLATVYFVEYWAADFLDNAGPSEMAHSQYRGRAEKAMRTWLAKR